MLYNNVKQAWITANSFSCINIDALTDRLAFMFLVACTNCLGGKAVNETFVFFLHNRALELQYLVYTFVCLWCRTIRTRCFDSHVSRHLDPYTFCWWLCLPAVHIACWSHKCNVFKMLLPDIAFMQLIKWRQQSQDTTWGQTLYKWEWNKPGFFMLGS